MTTFTGAIALIRTYLAPHRGRLTVLAGLLVSGSIVQLLGPLILRGYVDAAGRMNALHGMVVLAVAYFVGAAVQQAISIGDAYVATDLAMHSTNQLRRDLFGRALNLDLAFHQANPPGALIQRIDGDVNLLANLLSRMAVSIVGDGLLAIGVIVLLLALDWRVGIVPLLLAVVAGASLAVTSEHVTRAWKPVRERTADLYSGLEEILGATEDIAGAGAQAYAERRLQSHSRDHIRSYLRAILISKAGSFGITLVDLGATATLAVALLELNAGRLTIGGVFMVAACARLLLIPLSQLARQMQDLQPAGAALMRVNDLLTRPTALIEPMSPAPLPDGALALELENVTFAYASESPVLHEVDFRLDPGAILGIAGRTGSGKSTLARLIARLYDPSEGVVRVGGVDVRNIANGDLRRRVSYVSQEVHILDGTLRDNLTLFDATHRDDELLEAIHDLGLDQWLADREQGLDTHIASGAAMSAGEEQLVALARVFLRDPGLVILDEASARLDPVTEQRLETALTRLLKGRTAIVIAHRLETLERATHRMRLERGHVRELTRVKA